MDRAATLPGVTAVAFTTRLPVQPGSSTTTVVEGYTPPTGTDSVELQVARVSDDYFETAGLGVTPGRVFDRQDALGTLPVTLVNEAATRRFWARRTPLDGAYALRTTRTAGLRWSASSRTRRSRAWTSARALPGARRRHTQLRIRRRAAGSGRDACDIPSGSARRRRRPRRGAPSPLAARDGTERASTRQSRALARLAGAEWGGGVPA